MLKILFSSSTRHLNFSNPCETVRTPIKFTLSKNMFVVGSSFDVFIQFSN